MNTLLQSSVFIHILAACIWIGGSIFLAAIFVPMMRHETLSKHAYALFGPAARRFRNIGWICLVLLVVTGFLNIHARGISFHDSAFWKSDMGHLIMIKVTVVLVIVALSIYHDLVAGPRAVAARQMPQRPSSPQAA